MNPHETPPAVVFHAAQIVRRWMENHEITHFGPLALRNASRTFTKRELIEEAKSYMANLYGGEKTRDVYMERLGLLFGFVSELFEEETK